MIKFTTSHEWISDNGRIGITKIAQEGIGEIISIKFPEIGKVVKKGEEIVILESNKAAIDIYAPVSGKIIAINENLKSETDLINKSPEGDGWILLLEISNPKELDKLLTLEDYLKET